MKTELTKDEYLAAKRGQLVRMEGQLIELGVLLNNLMKDTHKIKKAHRTQNEAMLSNLDTLSANMQSTIMAVMKRCENTSRLISAMKLELFFEHE